MELVPAARASGQSRAYSWNRFATPNLSIGAVLAGSGHEFVFDGAAVRVKLPPATRAGDDDDARLRVLEWNESDAPAVFDARDVDVEIDQSSTPEISAVLDGTAAADVSVALVTRIEQTAERAFDHWLRMLRWRTKLWRAGRPDRAHTARTCTLYEHRTNRRLAAAPPAAAPVARPLSLEDWAGIQRALAERLRVPLYYDLYFEGREHLYAGDLRGAVVDFATACECFLKTTLEQRLPRSAGDEARAYVRHAPPGALLNGFAASLLDPRIETVLRVRATSLEMLFTARADVLQGRRPDDLTSWRCVQFRKATGSLLAAGEALPAGRPAPPANLDAR